eukprot:GDKJ01026387.1.p1 GENE.GDKJ01026387.1~~GDKJ01026387.1.p1  ORF type:complete len:252 (-),score=71.18 GDKJ01026387.1:37-792(-)
MKDISEKRKPRNFSKKRKVNLTPKKKKTTVVIHEKKKVEGYNEPFPVTVEEQIARLNATVESTFPSSTPSELSQMFVESDNIILTSGNSLSGLSSTLKSRNIELKKTEEAPFVKLLIMTLSAERALELGKIVEEEMKLREHPILLASHGGGRKADQLNRQKDSLKKMSSTVAIGTPGRVLRLFKDEALDLLLMAAEGALIVFDMEYDSKQRDVLGMPETKKDVAALLKDGLADALKVDESDLKVTLINKWD